MKKLTVAFLSICFSLLFSQSVGAADRVLYFPIQDAMNTSEAKEKLNSGVRFHFGARGPAARERLGTYTTSQRTNAFGKTDQASCNRVFLSAMIRLQSRAQSLGADAVVNIVSYFKKNTHSSTTDFECHVGAIMSGVALKGDFIRTR